MALFCRLCCPATCFTSGVSCCILPCKTQKGNTETPTPVERSRDHWRSPTAPSQTIDFVSRELGTIPTKSSQTQNCQSQMLHVWYVYLTFTINLSKTCRYTVIPSLRRKKSGNICQKRGKRTPFSIRLATDDLLPSLRANCTAPPSASLRYAAHVVDPAVQTTLDMTGFREGYTLGDWKDSLRS